MSTVAENKTALRQWDSHIKAIRQHTHVDVDENPLLRDKRKIKLEKNILDWAMYYFPHYCTAAFADFHKKWFDYVIEHNRCFGVDECARDHAKSVTTDVVLALFLVFTHRSKNVLLSSYNESNAIELITPIRLELENNQRLINDYGKQESFGQWESSKFVTRSGASFRAIGRGQSPRGARNQEARPDLIICDDLDDDETCRNPKRVDDSWEWTIGSLFGCFSITGRARFLVIGNRIAKDSILVRAIAQADFHIQVNILNAKGEPSWPQRFTKAECDYMIAKMGYRMSQREYFNNPISEGKVFKKEYFQFKKLPELNRYKCLLAYLDPGWKKTKTSDTKSVILMGLWEGKIHVRKVYCGQATINEMIEWCYEIDKYVKGKNAAHQLYMEVVFLQDLLLKDFQAVGKVKNFSLPVNADTRKKPDKDARILTLEGTFQLGNVYFDEAIEDDHHTQALVEQFLCFEPGVKTRKDGPDAFEGGKFLLEQMFNMMAPIASGSNKRKNKI